jgi:hypothetical protein
MFIQEALEAGFNFRQNFQINKINKLNLFEESLKRNGIELARGEDLKSINSRRYNEGVMNLCSYFFTERFNLKLQIEEKESKERRLLENISNISKSIKRLKSSIQTSRNTYDIKSFEVSEEFNKTFNYIPGTIVKNSRERNCEVRKGIIKPAARYENILVPESIEIDLEKSSKGTVLSEVDYLKISNEFLEYEVKSEAYLESGARLVIKGNYSTGDYISEILVEDFSKYECGIEYIEINKEKLLNEEFVKISYGNMHVFFLKEEKLVNSYEISFRQLKAESKSLENRDLYTDSLVYKKLERYPYSHKKNYTYNFSFKNIELRKRSPRNISCLEFKEKINLEKEKFYFSIEELSGNTVDVKFWVEVIYKEGNKVVRKKRFEATLGEEIDTRIREEYDSSEAKVLLVGKTEVSRIGKPYLISKVEIIYV